MAGGAIVFLENLITFDLLCSHSRSVTLQITVERRIRSEKGLLVLCNRVSDGSLAESFRIYGEETACKLLVLCYARCNLVEILASHLYRVERRSGCLFCKVSCTSVPELHEIENRIECGRRIHTSELAIDTVGIALIVHPRSLDGMA